MGSHSVNCHASGSGDFPAFTPAEAGTQFSDPGGMQGWVDHGALLIDPSKAFDTVRHQLLLTELLEIGCSTQVLDWFCNYLTNRLERVITYQEVTEWMTISRGFPQGSGLSPLLIYYSVFFVRKQCTSSIFQYADGTTANPELSVLAENLMASFYAVKEFCDSSSSSSYSFSFIQWVVKTQLVQWLR